MPEADQTDLTTLTVQLLSAYVSNNMVPSAELAGLIQSTRSALRGNDIVTPVEEFSPAVTVRKSLGSRDHIISMIDGKPYKTLKRHLSAHGLTPAEYRARYKLPKDYPTVAPGYSEQRREVAKRLGLGRRPAISTPVEGKNAALPGRSEAARIPPAAKKLAAGKAKSATPAKKVTAKPADKQMKAVKAAPAAENVSETATKPTRGRPRKAVSAKQVAAPSPAPKPRRGRKAAPKAAG